MLRHFTILITCFAMLTSACSLSTSPLPGSTPTQISTETPANVLDGTPAVTATTNIVETPDPKLFTAPDLTFTFMLPDGWTVQDPVGAYPGLQGPDENGFRPVMSFLEEQSEYALDRYTASYQDSFINQNTGYQAIGEETLSTNNGNPYHRWEFNNFLQGHILHYTVYFYASGNGKLVITYIRRDDTGITNDRPVDEAMQTVTFSR